MSLEEDRDRLADAVGRRGDVSDRVVEAIRAVPRHEFVPVEADRRAYRDTPIPIGEGQTCSAPSVVALICDRLDLTTGDPVLEVGTGCGYHAAVTAELVGPEHVYSVEYRDSLAADARENLAATGYEDVSIRVGDGRDGWPAHAPYTAAYLTCATDAFPDALIDQLNPGGRLVGPLGNVHQTLVVAEKQPDGTLDREQEGGVRFVEMQ